MMNTRKFLILAAISLGLVTSCSDDDDTPGEVLEEELITDITVTLTAEGADAVLLTVNDPDGADGPDAPVITTSGSFKANTVYTGSFEILNKSEEEPENVTEEIEELAAEHQFFFVAKDVAITTAYTDTECDYTTEACDAATAKPVGLAFSLTTAEAGTGTLRVALRHEPNKDAEGVAAGDITNAGGGEDIDVTFNVTVE